MNKISIVIPTLNEEETIASLLNHLVRNSSEESIAEIIVVDGGSSDNTRNIVTKFVTSSDSEQSEESYREASKKVLDISRQKRDTRTDIIILSSKKGRAKQMNAGAKKASGNILYFLHADSFPPKDFDKHIISEVEKGNPAGCFKMKFNHSHWWLRLASWLTKFSWRACRGGDQSQFITKDLFKKLGGFDEKFTIYEDNDLINKLYARNQFVVIQEWITTSARRYEDNGIWKLQYHFWTIYVKKWFGASAEELNRYYLKNIG